jgi:hypothetical protein
LSDIPAHRELAIPSARYFDVGQVDALAQTLSAVVRNPPVCDEVQADRERMLGRHDWRSIARQTLDVYLSVVHQRNC